MQMSEQHGSIHWSELMTRDAAKARAFFAKVAGWNIQEMQMGDGPPYLVCMQGEKPVAGIMNMEGPQFDGTPAMWMTYIAVDDVDKACETVSAEGGTVVQPCFDVEGVGRIAMIQDPNGAMVGIMTPAARPEE